MHEAWRKYVKKREKEGIVGGKNIKHKIQKITDLKNRFKKVKLSDSWKNYI